MKRLCTAACAVLLMLAGAVAPALARKSSAPKASSSIPAGFVGMNPDGYDLRGLNPGHQLDTIKASGVRSLRVPFYWRRAQPYKSWDEVPPKQYSRFIGGPVPTDFTATDAIVSAAAKRHMNVLPVVLDAPSWDQVSGMPKSMSTPTDYSYYADYFTLLIERYGPNGSFWSQNPKVPYLPIRAWQVWNEPNLLPFWATHPWLSSYIALLKAAHDAIKAADPGAKVVLAGLDNYSWQYIAWIEKTKGAASLFDVAAVHPYTRYPSGVMTILNRFRKALNHNGDRNKPILITEFGWPSALGQTHALYGFEANENTQASRLNELMPMLRKARQRLNLTGFYYYMWMGEEYRNAPSFNYAGLFAYRHGKAEAKPAYSVFKRWALAFDRAGG